MKKLRLFLALGISLALIAQLILPATTFAANTMNFKAGRIIDDAVFTNKLSMSVPDIQNFLNSKVSVCDNAGTKPSEYGGGTRSQYAVSRGNPSTFTCLKEYYQNPATGADNYAQQPIPAGAISAAQIIWQYSQQFSINPQVILATLQKENSMVTDDWPFIKQYREAMGFGCPDNVAPGAPACDPAYGSFSAQIYQAARHFRNYMDRQYCNSDWCTTYTVGNQYIAYDTDPNCGGSVVNIQNLATSALYSYTPYQPTQAALAAGYGSAEPCGSYGNRNFFNYFSDWFGNPLTDCAGGEPTLPQVIRLYNPQTYEHFYTALQCEANTLTQKHGFQLLGAAFNTSPANVSWSVPVYRLYNPHRQLHFWTTSSAESTMLQQTQGYGYEGVAFYTVNPNTTSTYPVYRIYNPSTQVHLWTLSLSEADNANRYGGYRYEGSAFYSQ